MEVFLKEHLLADIVGRDNLDFGYSHGLVRLGVIEAGVEKLARVGGDFTMTIERVD